LSGPTLDFWQERFAAGNLPWDRGGPNPQLSAWLAAGELAPGSRIIVPGCGQGWEVDALAAAGMTVTALDYTPGAIAMCRARLEQSHHRAELVEANVLHWQPTAPVDAVFEQTCLCALHPDYWTHYAAQLHGWLKPGGKLLALFMQLPAAGSAEGFVQGPPYHCDINAMRALFPATRWHWPKPPYPQIPHLRHPAQFELGVVLTRK
jgi:SAM-dependent methyltransferase